MRTELKKGEKKFLVLKKHWLVLVMPALMLGLFLLVTAIFYAIGSEVRVVVGNKSLFITLVVALYFAYKIFARNLIYGW
ncbi:MAG: hypothetical protein P9M03_08560 [Candidatus Theseobacter exili]|nr:hypothetical protein [Candidatus Theseobacter exili]